jgi:hypothetical protein
MEHMLVDTPFEEVRQEEEHRQREEVARHEGGSARQPNDADRERHNAYPCRCSEMTPRAIPSRDLGERTAAYAFTPLGGESARFRLGDQSTICWIVGIRDPPPRTLGLVHRWKARHVPP